VPCKFFKLGQCTAGSSCPFSHHLIEPGQQKDVCQWFVKGNCKFGHKCALAHILPGQPMSMDRKNKKAAQQAAAAAGGGGVRGERRKTGSGGAKEESLRIGIGRGIGRSAAPISISKATISPSAPAPPLRDTDFPFGLPDDFDQHVQAQTQIKQVEPSGKGELDGSTPAVGAESSEEATAKTTATTQAPELTASSTSALPQQDAQRPSPLPLSTPSTRRGYPRQNGSGDFGFGPIGSPPRSSPGHTPTSQPVHHGGHRINGFSPSTSPSGSGIGAGAAMPSTSPFSAPGTKSLFMSYSLDRDSSASTQIKASGNVPGGAGVAASLGGNRGWDIMGSALGGLHDEEDDLEEFLPSSLNELLTEEEKKRRWSRTGGQRPTLEQHHRYSRSVPAASLMDNVKNIWNENGSDMQPSGGPSPSLLGTSNVSTGFMPRRPAVPTSRAFSDSPNTPHPTNAHFGFNGAESPSAGGFVSAPLTGLYSFNRPQPQHPATSTSNSYNLQQPRPIPGAGEEVFNGNPLSPSARALQEHAPGQSLPQGLAAGLSRIHIKPPVALGTSTSPHHIPGFQVGSPSPALGATVGRGMSSGFSSSGDFHAGLSLASPSAMSRDPFDRLPSFGSRSGGMGTPSGNSSGPSPSPGSMGMGFRRQQWVSHPLSSPLSGPVITNDDADGLFAMDEDAK
jgi:RNA-binding, Nab2-type zinc finger